MCSPNTDPKLITNEEWAAKLTPEQYFCAREGGTEPVSTKFIHTIHSVIKLDMENVLL